MHSIPETGFLRLSQIVGRQAVTHEQARANRAARCGPLRARAGMTAIIPVCASTWWAGVRIGRHPKPIKLGGSTLWRVEDIRAFIARTGGCE